MGQVAEFKKLENIALAKALKNCFGYYSVVVGDEDLSFAKDSPIKNHFVVLENFQETLPGLVASFENLPFSPGMIDLVVLKKALEQSQSPADLLKEAKIILRHDGTLILSIINSTCFSMAKKLKEQSACKKTFILSALKWQLAEQGFSIEKVIKFGKTRLFSAALGYVIVAKKKEIVITPMAIPWYKKVFGAFRAPNFVSRTRGDNG